MAVQVTLNTPLAEALNNVVQPKLVDVGWSTGGLDDSALSEYIILMLVNGKTQDQIASELSNDLLNLGPDDSGAIDFSRWLFEQVEVLNRQLIDDTAPQAAAATRQAEAHAIPSYTEQMGLRGSRRGSRQSGSAGDEDADMGGTVDSTQDGNVYVETPADSVLIDLLMYSCSPTGPKSMRNGRRGSNKRLMGQLSKHMDRSHDAVLHRVRPQQGTERINTHNRQPPKAPRNAMNPNLRMPNTRPMGMPNGGMPNGGPSVSLMQMTPQQQMQLFAMYEEQARMMSQILSPQQQQMFMPGMTQSAINPAFHNGFPQQQPPGRSLFERVEGKPQKQNSNINRRHQQQNGASFHNRNHQDTVMDTDQHQARTDGELSSSMEVESSQKTLGESSPDTICKFNLACTKKDCPFAHQSPAAPPGTTIDVTDQCSFGAACKNRKCVGRHPSPAQKVTHQSEQDCKFFPNCTNPTCPFRHPTMPMCRNGADCTRPNCKFTHVRMLCRFNPCLNPACPYKHAEGQKRGKFDDKVWVADEEKENEHVSERKFIADDGAEEELIVPGSQTGASQPSSLGAEVVT